MVLAVSLNLKVFLPELLRIISQRISAMCGREDVSVVDDGSTAKGFTLVLLSSQGLNQTDLLKHNFLLLVHIFK